MKYKKVTKKEEKNYSILAQPLFWKITFEKLWLFNDNQILKTILK